MGMAPRSRKPKPAKVIQAATERIKHLFELAEATDDLALANRYVQLARRIAMKHKVRMPRGYKRRFCKHCYAYLKQGVTCRVRVQHGKVIYTCLACKKFMRFPLVQRPS